MNSFMSWIGGKKSLRDLIVNLFPLYITLHPQNWQHHNYVALCGVGGQAMMKMLELNPQIQEVSLCLDNDDAGHKASERLKNQLAESGCQCRRLISQKKDWNEDLVCRQQLPSGFEMRMA